MSYPFLSSISKLLSLGSEFRNDIKQRYFTTQQLGDISPEWIDTTHKFILYNEIPELQAVINRYSRMIASAKPIVRDLEGNEIIRKDKDHFIFDLIERPNALQSWSNMVFMTAVNKCVTNNALIYAPSGTLGNREGLTPLAYNNVKVVGTGKGLSQTTLDGFIKYFEIPENMYGNFTKFYPKDLIYICEPDGVSLFDTKSKLDSLKYPISNIARAYSKRNVLLKNLFSLGILSSDSSSDVSSMPLDDDGKKEILNDMKNRHNDEIIITDKNVKFDPMTFPTKDLMLFEEMTADKVALIDAFGLNQYMFGSPLGSGTTFSNVEMGERMAYNSTIIPDAKSLYDEFSRQLGLKKDGLILTPSFDGVSVLQKDENKAAEAMFKRAQAVEKIKAQINLTEDETRVLLRV